MNAALLVIGSIFVVLASALHVYIFVLESITWSVPRTWRIFGVASQADADVIKPMAFNQGFYNLFLGLGAGIGVALLAVNESAALALAFLGAGSMVLAALVLLSSSPANRRPALAQGVPPFIGIALILASIAA